MKPLTELVEELRRELSIALAGEAGRSADGVPLTLRKATLTLQIAMAEKPPHPGGSRLLATLIDRTPVENGATHPLQTLTLEYQVGSGGLPEPATPPAIAQGARGQATPEQLLQELRRVLGEPGFDSAARATVLCETLEGRPRQEVEPILASLDGKPGGPEAPEIRKPRHSLSGILRTGPLRSVPEGGEVLRRVFAGQDPAVILQLVRATWKTQDAWLSEGS